MANETLEDYLSGDYHQDMEDIRQLEDTLERTAKVFILAQHKDGAWPYLHRRSDVAQATGKVSHGTQAMIAVALARMTDGRLASGRSARLKLASKDDLLASLHHGVDRLATALSGGLTSGTFGSNDPVTLSHVVDLVDATVKSTHAWRESILCGIEGAEKELWEVAGFDPRIEALLRELPVISSYPQGEMPEVVETEQRDQQGKIAERVKGKQPDQLTNAFVPLRIVRSVLALLKLPERKIPDHFKARYRRYFESSLHEQLSYSDIPDSRFDPAELIFCLEGLILMAPDSVDDRLFERVLNVLESKQDESAHWRPSRPIYATHQGMTLLPVSVEGAVSLMRAIAIKDRNKDFQPLSMRSVLMLRRFWKWLQARAVRYDSDFNDVAVASKDVREAASVKSPFKGGIRHITGWHSEHVNDPELIHLWDTSQVAEFMLAYRELLQRAVAGRTLLLSRLKIDVPAKERLSDWKDQWARDKKKFEPRCGAGFKVYDKLTADFVEPWGDDNPRNFSILLYGPPGTGKTSLAENVAKALGMRMLTVSVSDFLGRGGANVEARAKAIFQTLEAQFDTVILFDEIDSFLLDRDSERYSKQDSLFQFLTPGMLTKINDLRKRERSIFLIATNYANRIDPAIKRKGRIDQQYLLPLPDAAKRLEIIADLRDRTDVSAANASSIRKQTLFFGYSDLRGLVKDAARKGGNDAALLDLLSQEGYESSTNLQTYLKRYPEENYPYAELLELIQLREEVEGVLAWDCLCQLVPEALLATPESASKDGSARATFMMELKKHYETRTRPPEIGGGTQQAERESGGQT